MYSAGVSQKKSDIQKRDEAFANSRAGAIVLGVTAAFTAIQCAILVMGLPPGVFDAVALGDEAATIALGTAIYVALYCLLALVLMLFAWLMRSRLAMALGLLLYALNWASFVMVIMEGGFEFSGMLMNVVGPYVLIRSTFYATRYHSLKGRRSVDPEVFA